MTDVVLWLRYSVRDKCPSQNRNLCCTVVHLPNAMTRIRFRNMKAKGSTVWRRSNWVSLGCALLFISIAVKPPNELTALIHAFRISKFFFCAPRRMQPEPLPERRVVHYLPRWRAHVLVRRRIRWHVLPDRHIM